MARRLPSAGRIVTCQISVMGGLPLSALVLKGLPTAGLGGGMDRLALTYGSCMLLMGFMISW